MDKEISKSEQSKNKLKSFLPIILIISVLALAYYFLKGSLQKKAASKDIHIVSVEKGDIRETLSAAGTVVAASERVINSPVTTEIAEVILTTGTAVKKGDLILKLDKEYTLLEYERFQDELALRKNNIEKLKLQFDKDLRDLDYQDQIKGLQLSELATQVDDQKRLLEIGGATKEELESAQLQLKISEIEKKVLENELSFKRAVNTTDKESLQLEYAIQSKKLKELKRKLAETKVDAPTDGVITWVNENIGVTVNQGEPLVKLANLDRYRIEGTTSDRNSKKLLEGLPVEVRIGKDRLQGQITRILPEIVNNTVRFYVSLNEENHKALRPNLRTEINIIVNNKEDVVKAKRGHALIGTKAQYFYKVVGNEAIKTRVTKGLVSSEFFEIESGLQVGDRIIVSDVSEFDHMDRFIIEK